METDLKLLEMTRERMQELYRDFAFDPDIFPEGFLPKAYRYDPEKVDRLFDMRNAEDGSLGFAVMHGEEVIGEVGLRKICRKDNSCELSIHLKNDAVKNKGYGTAAERMAVNYAFTVLEMETIYAETALKNARSQHVLEKLGFRYLEESAEFKKYQLTRKDWK